MYNALDSCLSNPSEHDIVEERAGLQIVNMEFGEFEPSRIQISADTYNETELGLLIERIEEEDGDELEPFIRYFSNIRRLQDIANLPDSTDPYDLADAALRIYKPLNETSLAGLLERLKREGVPNIC